jgi:hypothetical protein
MSSNSNHSSSNSSSDNNVQNADDGDTKTRGEDEKEVEKAKMSSTTVRDGIRNLEEMPLPMNGSIEPEDKEPHGERATTTENVTEYHKNKCNETKREAPKASSMGLRRLPMDITLQPLSELFFVSEVDKSEEEEGASPQPGGGGATPGARVPVSKKSSFAQWWWWIHNLFLSPKYTLKMQLMLSFGTVNFCTIVLVLLGCIFVSLYVGNSVKEINQKAFEDQLVREIQATTVRYLAESLEQQFIPVDLVDIIEEATQDRFQGYPNSLFNDDATPFRDSLTGRNIYPIVGDPMFLDCTMQKIKFKIENGRQMYV